MKTKITFLCGALALACSSGALAQATGIYGGVGIGKAKAALDTSDFTFNISGVSESKDEVTTAYKLFVGYQIIRFSAVEGSYTDLGKFGYKYDASGLGAGFGTASLDYKAKAWALSGVGTVPLGSTGLSALGRLGITYNIVERSALQGGGFTTTPVIPSATTKKTSLLWGLGAQYEVVQNASVRLEYENYGKFGEQQADPTIFPQQTGRAKIHAVTFSLVGRF